MFRASGRPAYDSGQARDVLWVRRKPARQTPIERIFREVTGSREWSQDRMPSLQAATLFW